MNDTTPSTEWPETMTDRDIARTLGRESRGKLQMVVMEDGPFYKRDADGTWWRLGS